MSRDNLYRIVDEPRATGLASIAVNPMWPLFAHMFGGAPLAWAWFVLNGFALGSPTRRRELLLALGGIAGVLVLALAFGALVTGGYLQAGKIWWMLLVVTLWKLLISYWLYTIQSRTFELYAYFGGPVRSGFLGIVAVLLLKSAMTQFLNHPFWNLLVT